jgi:hypothetical protein
MIVQPSGDQVRLIRQTDHAAQCGELAAQWGGDFEPVSPEVVVAARVHDNGWQEWEDTPTLDPSSGLPYSFFAIPVDQHLAIYRRGIDRAFAEGDWPGLLVSLHGIGLYNGRYGLIPDVPGKPIPADQEDDVDRFYGQQIRRQDATRNRLGIDALDPAMWDRYRLLQLWDGLSLMSLARNPQPRALGPVATSNGLATIDIVPLGSRRFSLQPWPFGVDRFETIVPSALVANRRYEAGELEGALAVATPDPMAVVFERH